ncbi:MAG: hypothetical protein J6R35_04940, partial [Clostridia bacterium]|nr:hypothetical protein [Clostridia bacterium]
YTIGSMTGKVSVNVSYEIKTYVLRKNTPVGYDTVANANKYTVSVLRKSGEEVVGEGAVINHHDTIRVDFTSLNGYYLASLTINGGTIATTNVQDGMSFKYQSVLVSEGTGKQLVIDDALLNGRNDVSIVPTTASQSFKVLFYVNRRQITTSSTVTSLGLYLENNVITYDDYSPAQILQSLTAGYSITNIRISLNPISSFDENNDNIAGVYTLPKLGSGVSGRNTYDSKDEVLNLYLTREIYSTTGVNFHDASKNTLRIYYTTALDSQTLNSSMYYVEGDGATNKGSTVSPEDVPMTATSNPAFTLGVSYSDNLIGNVHAYGTVATLRANINGDVINMYSFQGFQEEIDGVWTYVENGVNGISLENDGQTMRYSMSSTRDTRTFRAVFFRLYEIVVKVMPDYTHVEGNFGSSDPDVMKYRKYASMTATVTYAENNQGAILPKNADRTVLTDSDGNSQDGSYTYRVLSGAQLVLFGRDTVSMNSSKEQTYTSVTYDSGKMTQTEQDYAHGINTLEDRLIYAYFDNNLYVSFAMETVGSDIAAEGAIVTYKVNGNTVALNKNSIVTKANQNIEVTIVPNENFRYENILRAVRISASGSEYLQFSNSDYSEVASTNDGTISITYYNDRGLQVSADSAERISRVVLKLNNFAENAIFKIVLRKQVKLNRSISLVTDEVNGATASDINQLVAFTDDSSVGYASSGNGIGLYDYEEKLYFNLYFKRELLEHYQFVGYFINGVNIYNQLQQRYPYLPESSTQYGDYELKDLSLDDIGGLGAGVKIKTITDKSTNKTEYVVEVVAKFIPIYNVVVENEYVDEGVYLDPGSIISSAVVYDSTMPQYFETPFNSEANTQDKNNAQQFRMLGKINGIDHSSIKNDKSPYNVWNDNTITLAWQQRETSSGAFVFIAWQYLAYVPGDKEPLQWKNIPYVDSKNPSNAVTKTRFTFPISSLFETTYMPHLYDDGTIGNPITNSELSDSYYNGVPAIYLRARFQKVETLKIQKATAMETANDYYPGKGDVMPTIYGTSSSSGNFNYGTVQTMKPNVISGYEFVGWGIDTGANWDDSFAKLTKKNFNDFTHGNEIINGVTYTKLIINDVAVYCKEQANGGMADDESLTIYMDGSYAFVAYYRRIYNISIRVVNNSGIAPILNDSLPTIVLETVDGNKVDDTKQRFIERSFIVGTKINILLTYAGVSGNDSYEKYSAY